MAMTANLPAGSGMIGGQPSPVSQAIFRDLEAMIREGARERGIEVKENQVEGLILRRMSAMRGRKRLPQYRMVRVVLLRGAPDVLEPRI